MWSFHPNLVGLSIINHLFWCPPILGTATCSACESDICFACFRLRESKRLVHRTCASASSRVAAFQDLREPCAAGFGFLLILGLSENRGQHFRPYFQIRTNVTHVIINFEKDSTCQNEKVFATCSCSHVGASFLAEDFCSGPFGIGRISRFT